MVAWHNARTLVACFGTRMDSGTGGARHTWSSLSLPCPQKDTWKNAPSHAFTTVASTPLSSLAITTFCPGLHSAGRSPEFPGGNCTPRPRPPRPLGGRNAPRSISSIFFGLPDIRIPSTLTGLERMDDRRESSSDSEQILIPESASPRRLHPHPCLGFAGKQDLPANLNSATFNVGFDQFGINGSNAGRKSRFDHL